MLRRKAYDKLSAWHADKNKKALCIMGARQTGKTTVVRALGHEKYHHFVEINFITDPDAVRIFSGKLDADTITANLSAYIQKPMPPHETLVFLDEIQECPAARAAMKFLVEDGRFDYIESGSLLGVRDKIVPSYPVGFETLYQMYPMDFEEFLWANGVTNEVLSRMRDSYHSMIPLTESVHETMKRLFYSYIVVGGMPEVVQSYVSSHDIGRVIELQRQILDAYRQDISKYADDADKPFVRDIFDSIPAQLNDRNRRFFINSLGKDRHYDRYEASFRWLADAGVALPCYNCTEPQMPLELNRKRNLFRLYMGDTGLLCAASLSNVQFALLNGGLDINMGSILENLIAQSLVSNGYKLYYYDSKKDGELDFVVGSGVDTSVLEVKSGHDFQKHPSLNKCLAKDAWHFRDAAVLCESNRFSDGRIRYLPWYDILFFRPEDPPTSWIYKPDLSALDQGVPPL